MFFIRLLKAELLKMSKMKGILISLIILLIFTLGYSFLSFDNSLTQENWRTTEQAHLDELYKNLDQYQKDESNEAISELNEIMKDVTLQEISLYEYSLEKGIPVNLKSTMNIAYKCSDLLWLCIILVIVLCVSLLADEYRYGTVKQLIIRPYRRTQIIFGKQVSFVILSAVFFLSLFLISISLGFLFSGGNNSGCIMLEQIDGKIIEVNVLENMLLTYLSKFLFLQFLLSISILCVIIFRKSIPSLVITLGIFLGKGIINSLLKETKLLKYTIFPHMDLTQYIHGKELELSSNTLGFSVFILITSFIIINAAVYIIFSKKDT